MERTLLLKVPEDVYETLVKTAEEMEQPHKELAYLLKKLGQELELHRGCAESTKNALCCSVPPLRISVSLDYPKILR